jgi:hypothetical protein
LETVALDKPSSAAARAKDCRAATLAKIAQASKSGKVVMVDPRNKGFLLFLFLSLP